MQKIPHFKNAFTLFNKEKDVKEYLSKLFYEDIHIYLEDLV